MTRNNPASWGLKIPGRPPTPSEGYAQQYDRIGPAETQKLWTFDNGTCLTYGPDDLVDEFDPVIHPFCNQVALIDTLIRDNIAVRARYEMPKGDVNAAAQDPFNSFRQRHLDPKTLSHISLASGIYLQVPSRFASVSNLVSVYATPNKSHTPGEAHGGLTNDTRFGMGGKPSYNPLSQMVNRQDNIHRLTIQRQIQTGVSGVRRGRGRGGCPPGQQSLARIPQQFHSHYAQGQSYDQSRFHSSQPYHPNQQPNYQPKGIMRSQQKSRGRRGDNNNRGKFKDPAHRHERFRSQAYSVSDTPISNFAFPVINNETKKFSFQDYEDEGPSAGTPYGSYSRDRSHEDGPSTEGHAEQDRFNGLSLDDPRIDEKAMAPLRMSKGDQIHEGPAERFKIHPNMVRPQMARRHIFPGNPVAVTISQGTFPHTSSMGHIGGYQGSQADSVGQFEGYPPSASAFQPNCRSASHSMMFGQEDYVDDEDDYVSREYGKYLDELNKMSKARGETELAGDRLNAQIAAGHLPSDSFDSMQGIDSVRDLESRGSPTNNHRSQKTVLVDSIRARRFLRPSIGGSSTRPTTPNTYEQGRLSEPPRDRPSLLSPLVSRRGSPVQIADAGSRAFGEDDGNASTDHSYIGDRTRSDNRHFIE